MITIFILLLIIVLCFIVYRFYTTRKEPEKTETIYDSEKLYGELILILEACKNQIGKQQEAMELEKSIVIARNNEEQLMNLMPEVNRLFSHSVADLAYFYFDKAERFA